MVAVTGESEATLPPGPAGAGSAAAGEPEGDEILEPANDTATEFPDACVHELFERQVARTPDAIAIVCGDVRVTYRELDRRANQLAHHLRRLGIGPEVLVGVALERSPELVVALLGTWKAGGAYVPLDPAYPRERLDFMIGDAGVRALLTQERCRDLFPRGSHEVLSLDADWSRVAQERPEPVGRTAAPSNLAYVMYTSGSTGRPKGAMILHRGLVNYLWWAISAYGVRAGGSVPVHSSVSFDLTVTSLYPALLAGAHVELLPEQAGARHLLDALRRRGGRDLVKITPAHLELITHELGPAEAAGLTRACVIGGENLTNEILQPWRDFAPRTRLINEYGPTETVVGCCVYEVKPDDPRSGSVPIGRAIANTQLYVLDPERRRVPPGVTGELYIGGAGVARGYLNRPELTAERFVPDPFSGQPGARLYKTGDLARSRADGTLEYLGRVDDQVKVRGYRIELGEIEATLAGHPGVRSCTVVAREDTPGNKQLVAYVVRKEGASPDARALQAFAGERLPDYMVPALVAFLPVLPLTQNGKVDRKALPAPVAERAPAGRGPGPRNPTETALAAIWSELLNVKEVGVDDDFFELGGHSLLVIRALTRIREVLGAELPAHALFEHPTVASLAAEIPGTPAPADGRPRLARRKEAGPAPASFAQEQFWFLAQLVPGSPAYNISDVIRLSGRYDAAALRRALGELVRRHEILRTTFAYEDEHVVQVVAPLPPDPPVAEVTLAALPEADREREWKRVVDEEVRRPFDLSRGPLLRVTATHLGEAEHRVLLVVHHILADEWSMELIQEEVAQLYAAFARGAASPLPEPSAQYADFASWQRGRLQGDLLRDLIAYWKQELEGAAPVLALPTDRPRPAAQTFRGDTEVFSLPRALLDRLHALARGERATPFMVLEAAFAALLHRYTGQDDFLVGTPISERTAADTEQLVGCFLNTVMLRARIAPADTFRSLVQQVRGRALGAFAHAALPFERLIAEIAPGRDPGRTPLLQVMFIVHAPGGKSEVARISGNRELANGTSKFDLTLVLSETERGLEGLVEYSTDLFEAETIQRMCRCYGVLLEAAVREPDRALSTLPLLADADRRLLLSDWNGTAVLHEDGERLLHELFERQAARAPERVAIVFEHEALTYGELDARATRLARRLAGLGVGPDALVGLLVERSAEMVVALLAILKAGGAYVPLDPAFPPDRLAYMVEDSRMSVLLTHRGLEESLPARPPAIVRLDREPAADEPPGRDPRRPDGEHLAYVLYTSGSTGRPKGVGIPHGAIVNFLLSMQREPGLGADDVLLAVTTLSFDIAALELFLPLVTGARVVIAPREDVVDARRLAERLRGPEVTLMQATPATWRALVSSGWAGTPGLKALCGGEALPPDLVEALLPRCAELWNMYGPTETTVWSTVHRVRSAGPQSPPIGRPIANTVTLVLDAQRQLVPPGAVGELYIGGDGLARGYLHKPELTRERFVPNPFAPDALLYRTGDLARLRVDGVLECLGRTDHQVKIRGYRIELGEIEAVISKHPAVRAAVAVAREDTPGDKRLVAYFVADGPPPGPAVELRGLLRASLPEYMVPAHLVRLDALPLTPNGKIDRKRLPAVEASAAAPERHVAPQIDLEIAIAAAWQRVLGVAGVGTTDNFFDLGGTSLTALRLVLEVESATGLKMDLGAVLRSPTIAGMIESLGPAARTSSVVVPLQPNGAGVPVFCLCGINLYRDFANGLGELQPAYGVYVAEERALAEMALRGAAPVISVDALAEAYHQAILRVAPRGPYRLAGVSFGGILAMEVASRMRKRGERVELVMLLDCMFPRSFRRRWTKALRGIGTGETIAYVARRLGERTSKAWRKLREAGPIARDRKPDVAEAFEVQQAAFYRAVRSWDGRGLVSDFDVVLVRAAHHGWGPHIDFEDDYGWGPLVKGRLSVMDAPGDHLSIIGKERAPELGRLLQPFLRRA
jgi:amino acid adenylation domain-containing protein